MPPEMHIALHEEPPTPFRPRPTRHKSYTPYQTAAPTEAYAHTEGEGYYLLQDKVKSKGKLSLAPYEVSDNQDVLPYNGRQGLGFVPHMSYDAMVEQTSFDSAEDYWNAYEAVNEVRERLRDGMRACG